MAKAALNVASDIPRRKARGRNAVTHASNAGLVDGRRSGGMPVVPSTRGAGDWALLQPASVAEAVVKMKWRRVIGGMIGTYPICLAPKSVKGGTSRPSPSFADQRADACFLLKKTSEFFKRIRCAGPLLVNDRVIWAGSL